MNTKSRILIIEDDVDLVESMKKLLETKGYVIDFALDPEAGRKKIEISRPDLIILDVMFGASGESKGFDFANKIKIEKKHADIPVLMLTAINTKKPNFSFSPETDGEFLPVDSFLEKPIQPEALFMKVEELLQQETSKWKNWPEKTE